jgi:hypothetical protein
MAKSRLRFKARPPKASVAQVQALVANIYGASPEILRKAGAALGYE